MAKIFLGCCVFLLISVIFRGKPGVKVGPKVQTSGLPLSHKNSNPLKNAMLLFARVQTLVRVSANLDHIWGSKNPKTSQKDSFHELNWYAKLWKFLAWQPLTLYWWNLSRLSIFTRVYLRRARNTVFWLKI